MNNILSIKEKEENLCFTKSLIDFFDKNNISIYDIDPSFKWDTISNLKYHTSIYIIWKNTKLKKIYNLLKTRFKKINLELKNDHIIIKYNMETIIIYTYKIGIIEKIQGIVNSYLINNFENKKR